MTRTLLFRCPSCQAYTLREKCPSCGTATKNPLPPKFSPEDPYGEYRRKLKQLGPAKGA